METLKKVWLWLCHYWYIPVLLILAIVLFIFFGKENPAWKLLLKTQNDYSKQLDELNKLQVENQKQKEELLTKYNTVVAQLDKKYQEDQKKITEEEKQQIKKYVDSYSDEELAKKLVDQFGLNLIK